MLFSKKIKYSGFTNRIMCLLFIEIPLIQTIFKTAESIDS